MSTSSLAQLLGPAFCVVDDMLNDLGRGDHEFMRLADHPNVRLANPPAGAFSGIPAIDPPPALLAKLGIFDFKNIETNAILSHIKQRFEDAAISAPIDDGESEDDVKQALLLFDCDEFNQWTTPEPAVIQAIFNAPWKVVDVETTGLVAASKSVNLSNKELRAGDDATLRLRVITVVWWDPTDGLQLGAFDMDRVIDTHGKAVHDAICAACLHHTIIGHNIGFDCYWLALHTKIRPTRVIDTMLLGRLVRYDLPVRLADIVGERDPDERHFYYDAARTIFLNKGKGTWSLETFVALLLNEPMEKGYQKPRHWTRAVLSKEHYDYATSDANYTYRLICNLLGIAQGDDLLGAYETLRANRADVRLVEPQVPDVLAVRMKGIPVDAQQAVRYAEEAFTKAARLAEDMAALEPTLAPFKLDLADPSKGLTADLKAALCKAFEARGVPVLRTEKTNEPKVGEKDLRLAGAERLEAAEPLFKLWVGLSKAQKAGNMALDVKDFAARSDDKRLHPLLGHGPVTGRLSSAEPNSQQFPGDPAFRAIVRAPQDHQIGACDYSALDVRVGAALCIRAQRQIYDQYQRGELREELMEAVQTALEWDLDQLTTFCLEQEATLATQSAQALMQRDWRARDVANHQLLLHRFMRRLAQVCHQAQRKGETEWSALREAFRLNLDIHTYTTLKMNGFDPDAIFAGLDKTAIESKQDELKKELGGKRKGGKVANLGLLYGMLSKGFAEYANKIFNMGWSVEFADQTRRQWLDAYPEVDLWHCWTELNPCGRVWLPNPDSGSNKPIEWYESETLGGRKLIAFGLNAALSYGDQGTGADIVGTALILLRKTHPEVYATVINQVHDEIVFEIPTEHVDTYGPIIADAMVKAGNKYTMPYGVPIDAGLLVGDVWMKD